MNNKEKTKEIKKKIETHEALIESLRTHLKETEENIPYGPTKTFIFKAIQVCTSPFAKWNKNVEDILADPELHALEQDVYRLEKLSTKTTLKLNEFKTEKKISNAILKLVILSNKILANPAYISQRYSEQLKVDDMLQQGRNLERCLKEIGEMLQIRVLTSQGISDTPNETLEKIANPIA